ncbi:mini-MOMP protein [Campylobacter volucris]|uniref:Mini-MOMP protein n=1 Tax=Campylobacter volucris TaxID=1031542 RepID=A0A5C7DVW7_9BACT|nr:mini-MOMP protein [Campylobacter volucris]TXE88180.1 mini-MOMP protein [Campylobacter volucris]
MKKIFITCLIFIMIFLNIIHAAPLDEIFQDVNVSGKMQYRFEYNNPKNDKSHQRIKIPTH